MCVCMLSCVLCVAICVAIGTTEDMEKRSHVTCMKESWHTIKESCLTCECVLFVYVT